MWTPRDEEEEDQVQPLVPAADSVYDQSFSVGPAEDTSSIPHKDPNAGLKEAYDAAMALGSKKPGFWESFAQGYVDPARAIQTETARQKGNEDFARNYAVRKVAAPDSEIARLRLEQGERRLTQGDKNLGLRTRSLDQGDARLGETKGENVRKDSRFSQSLSFREEDAGLKRKERSLDAFEKDPNIRKLRSQQADAARAETMLDTAGSNPVATEAAKSMLARASGEVGVLTDTDIARFGGSKALAARAAQATQEMIDGRLTPQNRAFMKDVAQAMGRAAAGAIAARGKGVAKQRSKATAIPEAEILDMYGTEPQAPATVLRRDPKSGRHAEFDAATKKFLRWVD